MSKKLLPLAPLLLPLIVVVFFVAKHKPEDPPFWFHGNKLDWEIENKKRPMPVDEISNLIIRRDGLSYVPWDKDRLWMLVGSADTRWQWEGDKLLVRSVTGEGSFFSGGGHMHPPLKDDPIKSGKTLRECLDPDDDGKIGDFNPRPSLTEALEASGAKVTKPKVKE